MGNQFGEAGDAGGAVVASVAAAATAGGDTKDGGVEVDCGSRADGRFVRGEAGDGGDYGVEEGDLLRCHARFEPHRVCFQWLAGSVYLPLDIRRNFIQ